ncbi:MAG TPA: hypothetical protein VGA20_01520, partial [Gemmatimonadales bacterium]
MKPATRFLPFLCFATLFGCNAEKVAAPEATLSLNLSGRGGNPDCQISARDRGKKDDPLALVCTIEIPGNAITSAAKSWVDQVSGTYYLAHASNAGVEMIDIATHTWVGRVTGFVGAVGTGGGTATSNGAGPSSFTEGLPGQLWVSDGNSMLRLVDTRSGQIVASVSTAIAACDGGTETTHYCGRSNEIGYDPEHHIVLVSNPSPLTVSTPHVMTDPYATFVSARPPYAVLGHVTFPGAGNAEGHTWVPELQRFLLPVQPTTATNATRGTMYIAVINPRTVEIEERRVYYCPDFGLPLSNTNNNLRLGRHHHLLAQTCGRPMIMDVRTGEVLNVVTQVGTGDQDWYNPGDDRFYVFGADAATGVQSLGMIDARDGAWLQNVPLVRGAYPAAYVRTNEVFGRVQINAAIAANPATDDTACEVKGRGCVAVFAHVGG